MKKIIFFSALAIATFFTNTPSVNAATSHPILPDTGVISVKVSAGTLVLFETIREINTETVRVSNTIALKVRANVVVKGKVVISANTMAVGHVTRVWGATATSSGGAEIEVRDVQAVDDTMINLNGTYQLSENCDPGQPCIINARFPITAHVMNINYIDVEN